MKPLTQKLVDKPALFLKGIHYRRLKFNSPMDLTKKHFATWSSESHPNYSAFMYMANLMNGSPWSITETGTSAQGTDSTRFWDRYVDSFGGTFTSIDLRKAPSRRLKLQTSKRTRFLVGDSATLLKKLSLVSPNVIYLDSWDVDWNDSNPASLHGLEEFVSIKNRLSGGDVVMIDDTPCTHYPNCSVRGKCLDRKGKGSLVIEYIKDHLDKYEILFAEYAIVFKVIS